MVLNLVFKISSSVQCYLELSQSLSSRYNSVEKKNTLLQDIVLEIDFSAEADLRYVDHLGRRALLFCSHT